MAVPSCSGQLSGHPLSTNHREGSQFDLIPHCLHFHSSSFTHLLPSTETSHFPLLTFPRTSSTHQLFAHHVQTSHLHHHNLTPRRHHSRNGPRHSPLPHRDDRSEPPRRRTSPLQTPPHRRRRRISPLHLVLDDRQNQLPPRRSRIGQSNILLQLQRPLHRFTNALLRPPRPRH